MGVNTKLFPIIPEQNRYQNTYGTVLLKGQAPRYHVSLLYKPLLAVCDFLGGLFFFWSKHKKQPIVPKKVLAIRLDHLGDVVMTLPAYAALRKQYPRAEIHTLVRGFAQDIFYKNKNVDRVIPFDPPWFAREKKNTYIKTLLFLLQLRKEKYDIVVELHADPRNILAAAIIGGYLVGYGIRGFGFLLNKTVMYPHFDHLVETNTDLIRALGYTGKTHLDALMLSFSKKDESAVQQYYQEKKVILINPGTGRPNKYWLPERWAVVADALVEKGYSVFFTGSGADVIECEKITEHMKEKAVIIAGKTTLRQLFALTKHAQLVLAPDTALPHFCACLGIPCITLFGPIPPAICSYQSSVHRPVVKTLPCSYCARAVCPRTDTQNECMLLISAEEIISLAQELLSKK